jgi:hypothetical protein
VGGGWGRKGKKDAILTEQSEDPIEKKWVSVFGAQNEQHFEGEKRQSRRKIWSKIDHFQGIG